MAATETLTTTTGRATDAELQALLRRWHTHRDDSAREALISRFLWLARSLARRYDRSTESLDDLVQVASLGLIKAVDRFDPTRGTTFISFAVPTILGELKRYFRDHSWAVHVPRGAQERVLRLEEARHQMTMRTGHTPTVEELAQYLELTPEVVLETMQAGYAYDAVSLDAPRPHLDDEHAATYGETLGAEDERYTLIDSAITISDALRQLPERERRILSLRFVDELTQAEIADRIGISQMQVSRILRKTLDRLREIAEADAPRGGAKRR